MSGWTSRRVSARLDLRYVVGSSVSPRSEAAPSRDAGAPETALEDSVALLRGLLVDTESESPLFLLPLASAMLEKSCACGIKVY